MGELECPRGRHHALRRPEEDRVAQQAPEPAQPVTHRRWREVEPLRRAADVALPQDGLEEHQEIQVDPGEVSFVQHLGEIISLDAAGQLGGILVA